MKVKIALFMLICLAFISCDILKTKKADCVIVGSVTVQEDFEGDIKFLGQIKNQGTGKALYVKITFTMKDAGGGVIDTDFTYVASTDLDIGQTSSFECWTYTPRSQVANYTYEITWQDEE